jgi:arsenate reductase-like glutaredoxin family protein
MISIYTLKTCDSCRKATKWLTENHIPYQEIAIREQPPSLADLKPTSMATSASFSTHLAKITAP